LYEEVDFGILTELGPPRCHFDGSWLVVTAFSVACPLAIGKFSQVAQNFGADERSI